MVSCQFSWIQFLWIIVPLTFALIIWTKVYRIEEPFVSTKENQTIIELYNTILDRNPTSNEILTHTKALDKSEYTFGELEIRLYNSDEYKRMVKTQSNRLSPEMSRMVEEKEVIDYIRELYFKARAKKADKSILLPLRDLFVYFDYNSYKLLALFRHTKYSDFEEEFKDVKNLSKDTLIELYHLRFDDSKLTQDGEALRKTEKLKPLGGETTVTGTTSSSKTGGLSMSDLDTIAEYLKNKSKGDGSDADKSKISGDTLDGKGKKTSVETGAGSFCTNQRYYLDQYPKLKSSGFGFMVPEKHPPVCIPVGQKNSVSPVVFGDLMGTNLNEANDTQVGSILPKFEYNEYIELPTAVKNCNINTSTKADTTTSTSPTKNTQNTQEKIKSI